MATLSGNKIKNTYQALVKFSDNGNITTSAKQLTDGFGNNSPMWVSTTQVGIGVTPEAGLNLHVYGDAKIGSNLTVIGNLVVEGSTTTVGTDTLTVKDPLIVLANNNTSTDAVDIGFYGKYTPSGTTLYSGLFREALTGKYRLFKGLQIEPTTTVSISGTGYDKADLVIGNIETNGVVEDSSLFTFSKDVIINKAGTTKLTIDNVTQNKSIELECTSLNNVLNAEGDMIFSSGSPIFKYTSSSFEVLNVDSTFGGDITVSTGTEGGAIFLGSSASVFSEQGITFKDTDTTIQNAFAGGDIVFKTKTGAGSQDTHLTLFADGTSAFTGQVTIPLTPSANTDAASKGYVDTQVGANNELSEVLANGNTTGGTDIVITAGDKITNFTSTGIDDNATSNILTIADASSTFAGTITAPTFIGDLNGTINTLTTAVTQSANNNSTKVATTAYVDTSAGLYLPLTAGTSYPLTDSLLVNVNANNKGIQLANSFALDNASTFLYLAGKNTAGTFKTGQLELLHDGSLKLRSGGSGTTTSYGTTALTLDTSQNATFAGSVTTPQINLNSAGGGIIDNQTGNIFIQTPSGTGWIFRNGPSGYDEKMRIESTGVVKFPNTATSTGDVGTIAHYTNNYMYIRGGTSGLAIGDDGFDTSIYLNNSDSIQFQTGGSEKMRITSGGNVAIGGTLGADSQFRVELKPAATILAGLRIGYNSTSNNYFDGDNQYFRDGAGTTNRMVIDSSGNVGIGTTSPHNDAGGLSISATSSTDQLYLERTGSATARYYLGTASNSFYIVDDAQSATRMVIDSSGNLLLKGTGTTSLLKFDSSAFGQIQATGNTLYYDVDTQIFRSSAGTERMRIDSSGTTSIIGSSNSTYLIAGGDGDNSRALTFTASASAVSSFPGAVHTIDAPSSQGAIAFATFGTERMRIDTSGNVGIATSTNLSSPLTIQANTSAQAISISGRANGGVASISFYDDDQTTQQSYIQSRADDNEFRIWASASTQELSFGAGGTERLRITSGGNIHISGGSYTTGSRAKMFENNPNTVDLKSSSSGTGLEYHQEFANPNSTVGSITTNASATAFNTTSDYRLKEDLQDFNGLDKVSKIKMYDFKWKTDENRSYGVMAHELQEVLPQAVSGEKDAEKMQQVDYSKIVPLLVKSIQELKAEIESLKQQINN